MTTPLSMLADSILAAVENPAAVTHTSRSVVGSGLNKIASELRDHRAGAISYADLEVFRKTHGV